MVEKDKTFIRITNRDIYEKIEELSVHVKETNGKVKLNKWMSGTSLSLAIIALGVIARIAIS